MNTIRVSNSLDPDQARWNVGPDLGPNCLQTTLEGKKVKKYMHMYGPSILFLYRNLYIVCVNEGSLFLTILHKFPI